MRLSVLEPHLWYTQAHTRAAQLLLLLRSPLASGHMCMRCCSTSAVATDRLTTRVKAKHGQIHAPGQREGAAGCDQECIRSASGVHQQGMCAWQMGTRWQHVMLQTTSQATACSGSARRGNIWLRFPGLQCPGM
jgi:hypothetical protein